MFKKYFITSWGSSSGKVVEKHCFISSFIGSLLSGKLGKQPWHVSVIRETTLKLWPLINSGKFWVTLKVYWHSVHTGGCWHFERIVNEKDLFGSMILVGCFCRLTVGHNGQKNNTLCTVQMCVIKIGFLKNSKSQIIQLQEKSL